MTTSHQPIETFSQVSNIIDDDQHKLVIKKNSDLVYKAAFCWAFMFSFGESNLGLFADHLKSPLSFYAALIWIPALLGPLIQIVSANMLDRYGCRVKMCYVSVYIQAASFIPLIIITIWGKELDQIFKFEYTSFSNFIFIISVTIYFLSGSFAGPPWQSFIGDLVEPNKRGEFFAKISKINSIITFLCFITVGYILYATEKYWQGTFQTMALVFFAFFVICLLARVYSGLFIQKMTEISYQANASSVFTFWQFIKRAHESNFVKFVIFVSVLNCGLNIAGPYYIPFWLETLQYTKTQWIIFASVGTISSIFTFMVWGRFSDQFGNKKTIKYCSILIAFIPFGWFVSLNFYYLLVLQMLGMAFFTGFALSTLNYIYEAATPLKRARCFAYYGVLTGVGTYVGTQIGLLISTYFNPQMFGLNFTSNFYWVLIFSGIVRLIACLLFLPYFKELREVKPFQMTTLWYEVLQAHTIISKKNPKKQD